MNCLLDTHLLLWVADESDRLSPTARRLIEDETTSVSFSVASIWEVSIKASVRPIEFVADPRRLRRMLVDNGWIEIPITSEHAVAIRDLPPIHADPFDRMLLAQAHVEGMTLLTSDAVVAQYPGDVRKV
ncbi:MAG: type II toxin-antitoxin system VapC family toxin [Parvularculaceae bacterium]